MPGCPDGLLDGRTGGNRMPRGADQVPSGADAVPGDSDAVPGNVHAVSAACARNDLHSHPRSGWRQCQRGAGEC